MRVRHPNATTGGATRPPVAVIAPDGIERTPDDGGWVDAPPEVARQLADRWSRRFGLPAEALLAATCEAVKADGEVCGRELPCRYHDDTAAADE